MAKLNRETLKSYFKPGERPSEKVFSDLIDSTINILDDNFPNYKETSLKITGNNDRRTTLAIYTEIDDKESLWNIDLAKNGNLSFCSTEKKEEYLTLSPEGNIILKGKQITLKGNVTQGIFNNCPANGKWQEINQSLPGVNIYEITAVYTSATGSCKILRALVSHCGNRNRRIKRKRPFSFFWQNKIKIKWKKQKNTDEGAVKFGLYIRSRYASKDRTISYSINRVWPSEITT